MLKSLLSKPVASARKFAPKKKVEDKTKTAAVVKSSSVVVNPNTVVSSTSVDGTKDLKDSAVKDVKQILVNVTKNDSVVPVEVVLPVDDTGKKTSFANETEVVPNPPVPVPTEDSVVSLPPPVPPVTPAVAKKMFGIIHAGGSNNHNHNRDKKSSASASASGSTSTSSSGVDSSCSNSNSATKSTHQYLLESALERRSEVSHANTSILPSKLYGDDCPHELITVYLRKQPVDVSVPLCLYGVGMKIACVLKCH